jgi:hypothetical protein
LAAWWQGEGNANDVVGGLQGTPLNGTSFAAGEVALGFSFNGSTGYVTNNPPALTNVLNTYTMEFWAWPTAGRASTPEGTSGFPGTSGQRYAIFPRFGPGFAVDAPVGAGVSVGTNGISVFEHGDSYLASPLVYDTPLTNWTHIAVVYIGQQPRLYVNGTLARTGLVSTHLSYPSTCLGESGKGYGYYAGLLDEFSIYNRALTATEVLSIYNARSAGKCGSSNGPPYLMSQPRSVPAVTGGTVHFDVLCGGTTPLFYQWRLNGTNVSGATDSTLQLVNVQLSQAGDYQVTVTNNFGSIVSSNATLTLVSSVGCAPPPSGLVAWWQAEGDARATIGGPDGVLINGTSFAPGMVAQAFSFNGLNNYVTNPTPAILSVSNSYTMEFWARPTAARATTPEDTTGFPGTGSQRYAIFPNNGGSKAGAGVSVGTNGVSVFEHGDTYLPSLLVYDAPILDWTHVAVVYIDKQPRLYLNGTLVRTGLTSTRNSYPSTCLGEDGHGYGFYAGLLDEVTIYNRPLTPSEIFAIYSAGNIGKCTPSADPYISLQPTNQTVTAGSVVGLYVQAGGQIPLFYQWQFNGSNISGATATALVLTNVQFSQAGTYQVRVTNAFNSIYSSNAVLTVLPVPPCAVPPPGLVDWWRGEGDANDSAGIRHGVIIGPANFSPGSAGFAFNFNGVNNYVSNALPGITEVTNSYTMEFWAWPTAARASTQEALAGISGNANQRYAIFPNFTTSSTVASGVSVGTNGVSVFEHGNSYLPSLLVYDTPITTWTHVAVVYSNQQPRLYLNGALVRTGLTSTRNSYPSAWLGESGMGYGYYAGLLDEVSIYNRSLTAAEVQSIYNAGAAGKCLLPPQILSQPGSRAAIIGTSTTFTVAAAGALPLTYEWRFNGVPIAAATNSSLTLSNLVMAQSGNYSVFISNPAGSITSSVAVLTVTFPPAPFQVVSTNVNSGGTVGVPITLGANGNENALAFSLSFDPTLLTYATATASAPGAILIPNTSSLNSGRLGLALVLPPGSTLTPGTQQVAVVNFGSVITSQGRIANLAFGDQPTPRQLLDNQLGSLGALYSNGSIAISPATALEGDVSPRPFGDTRTTLADWLQMGRYVARLDYPTNSVEFQRADCAPRSTAGDGAIKVTDWVQAGRYSFGLDTLSIAAGPTNEVAGPGPAGSSNRVISVSGATIFPGETATLPISVSAQGDENALSFSLSYDPSLVTYIGEAVGSDALGSTLFVNTNQAASGQLGFALALPPGVSFGAGPKELARVSFQPVPGASGSFSAPFIDLPAPREVSSPLALPLPVGFASGSIIVSPPPVIRISSAGTNMVLSWPSWATNYSLQEAADFTGPLAWTNVPAQPTVGSQECSLCLPGGDAPRFYRLKR